MQKTPETAEINIDKNRVKTAKSTLNLDFSEIIKPPRTSMEKIVADVASSRLEVATKQPQNNASKTTAYRNVADVADVAGKKQQPERRHTNSNAVSDTKNRRDRCGYEGLNQRLKKENIVLKNDLETLQVIANNDWLECVDNLKLLQKFDQSVHELRQREQGIIPDGWTSIVQCRLCGSVCLWKYFPKKVSGCPWCHNRTQGLAIPTAKTVDE